MTERTDTGVPRARLAVGLGMATVVVFGGAGWWLMAALQDRDPVALLLGPWPWWQQLLAGLALGFVVGRGAWFLIARPGMHDARSHYARLIGPLMARWEVQLFVSACAGIGEELFFRGALQHWLGIVPTAIAFVAIHGYLDPRDRGMLRYGLFLTAAMCVLGLAAERAGLLLPMVAHAVIDAVLIARLVDVWREPRH